MNAPATAHQTCDVTVFFDEATNTVSMVVRDPASSACAIVDSVAGPKGTLVMFICNHCPYVLAVLDRIIRDATELQALGVGVAAICANDATTHPDDSYENMQRMAVEKGFPFPYSHR